MKTYHGQRTARGCEVTVDGRPLPMRSDLSGNATPPFDWGYVGTGQLSLALLSDLLGNDQKAKAMSEVFEAKVVAELPLNSWTMTEHALATALAPLVGVEGARADDGQPVVTGGVTFGDMPVNESDLLLTAIRAEDTAANAAMTSEGGHANVEMLASDGAVDAARRTADEAVGAAIRASGAAVAAQAARDVARRHDAPVDEAISTANRAVDHVAYSADRAADKAVIVARAATAEAKGSHDEK
jgi:hypothetical protein